VLGVSNRKNMIVVGETSSLVLMID